MCSCQSWIMRSRLCAVRRLNVQNSLSRPCENYNEKCPRRESNPQPTDTCTIPCTLTGVLRKGSKSHLETFGQFMCSVWRPAQSGNQNAPGVIRTRNRLIRSQVLYPLSYGGERKHYTACPSIFARWQLFQIVIVVNRPGDIGKQEISPVEDHLHGVVHEHG